MTTHAPVIHRSQFIPLVGERTDCFAAACTCGWEHFCLTGTRAQAEVAHTEHAKRYAGIAHPLLAPGDRVRFADALPLFLVRAVARGGRFAIATTTASNRVYYTVIDRLAGVRGALLVDGWATRVRTAIGSDAGIDEMVRRLDGVTDETIDVPLIGGIPSSWSTPGRVDPTNQTPLRIVQHLPASTLDADLLELCAA